MKKITLSLISILASVAVVTGATIAFFNQTNPVDEGLVLGMGTVDLDNAYNLPFTLNNIVPGGEYEIGPIGIRYTGSVNNVGLYVGAQQTSGKILSYILEYKIRRYTWDGSEWVPGTWVGSNGWKDIAEPFSGWIKTHSNLNSNEWAYVKLYIKVKDGNGVEEGSFPHVYVYGGHPHFNNLDWIRKDNGAILRDGENRPVIARDWNDYQGSFSTNTIIFYAVQEGGPVPTESPSIYEL